MRSTSIVYKEFMMRNDVAKIQQFQKIGIFFVEELHKKDSRTFKLPPLGIELQLQEIDLKHRENLT